MARLVKRAGGEAIIFIKDNTPAARADLELFFEDPEADRRNWQVYEQIGKGHGRLERRHLTTSPDLNDYLRRDWGEVGQVFRVERERRGAYVRWPGPSTPASARVIASIWVADRCAPKRS